MDYKDISLKDLAKSSAQQEEVQLDVQKETEIIEEKVQELSPEDRKRVDDIKREINLTDSALAVEFGVGAQKHLSEFSGTILSNVRNKDSGEIGELLTGLMGEIKSLDVEELGEEKKGFLKNLP
ncbi:MAG: toxic anion resistance protein, partial [Tissierellia bacterium]|nr:toxic anion resistance protein [Tissierellia bacterium]